MKNFISIIVDKNDQKLRVDSFISNKEKELSRTRIKNLILNNKLKLNKKLKINKKTITDPSKKIYKDDFILLEIPEPKKASLKPFNFKQKIKN